MFFPLLPANEEGKRLVSQPHDEAFAKEQHGALTHTQPAEKRTKSWAETAP